MAKVGTYLNFVRETEEAFTFYKSVFGGDFEAPGIMRFSSHPPQEGVPPLPEADKNLILHVSLPILGGAHNIMGSDAPPSMGFNITTGNNVHITLSPDSRGETKKIFDGLSKGGTIEMDLQDTFWGAYYGSCTDKFGVKWMFNTDAKN